jgi:hypothetical protein
MIYLTSIFDLPFLFLIMLIDTYLFLTAARFIIGLSTKARKTHIYNQIKLFTDFVPDLIHKYLAKGNAMPKPTGLLWFVAIVAIVVLRQIVISIILM